MSKYPKDLSEIESELKKMPQGKEAEILYEHFLQLLGSTNYDETAINEARSIAKSAGCKLREDFEAIPPRVVFVKE